MSKDRALEFLKKVAEAETLSTEVQKGDINNTLKIAATHGYHLQAKDVWDAITELQQHKPSDIPGWIIDRLRVAVHD
jgi:hypothetical protein